MSDLVIKDNLYLFKLNKDMVIEFILNELYKKNKLIDKTIIIPAIDYDALSYARAAYNKGYKSIIVLPNNANEKILNELYNYKIDIVLTPFSLGFEALIDMANDMKLEIENSIVLNRDEEKLNVSSYLKLIGPMIFDMVKDFNYLICPIETGGAVAGLGKYFKMKNECHVIGLSNGDNHSELLDDDLIDEIIELNDLRYDTVYEYAKSFMSNNINEKALVIFDIKKL